VTQLGKESKLSFQMQMCQEKENIRSWITSGGREVNKKRNKKMCMNIAAAHQLEYLFIWCIQGELKSQFLKWGAHGSLVVKALGYKPEGGGFET
jgi:hypothetical protein